MQRALRPHRVRAQRLRRRCPATLTLPLQGRQSILRHPSSSPLPILRKTSPDLRPCTNDSIIAFSHCRGLHLRSEGSELVRSMLDIVSYTMLVHHADP